MLNQTRDHLLLGGDAQRRYVVAGNAMLTLRSNNTDTHVTYRVEASEDLRHWLVYHLIDGGMRTPVLIGWIRRSTLAFSFRKVESVRTAGHSRAIAAWGWWWKQAATGATAPNVEVWGSGVCARCGRDLTDPLSARRGIGPVCWVHVQAILDVRPRLAGLAEALRADGFASPLWAHAPAEVCTVEAEHLAVLFEHLSAGTVANIAQVLELLYALEVSPAALRTLAGVAGALAVHAEGQKGERKALREALAEIAPPARLAGWWVPTTEEVKAAA